MGKLIYLDNAATTPTAPEVIEAMLPFYERRYGNPSALYDLGQKSHDAIEESRKIIAQSIGAQPEEIYFTAGGSESDNWALKATAEAYKEKGKHIITSKIEHHAILHTCEWLERQGFEVTYLDVDENGRINPADVEAAIRPDTILISIMFANNEIGTIEPIAEIGAIAKAHGVLFHTDAVQAFGQEPIQVDEMNIDMLSSSGHKLNGPKGIGFLYIRKGVKIRSFVHGGAQERKRRAGTENVPAIAGLGEAAEEIYENLDEKRAHLYGLKQRFIDGIEKLEGTHVNGKTGEDSAPHIVSVSFEGIRSEVLLHSLEDRGIYVSSGSACSSNNHAGKQKGSKTLRNIHLKENLLDSTLRFSFSVHTTEEEIDYALEVLGELLPVLKKYTRH